MIRILSIWLLCFSFFLFLFFFFFFSFSLPTSIGKNLIEYTQLARFPHTVRYPDVLGNSQPALVNRQLVANGPSYVGKDPAC